jgi:uncharacterized protein (DUF934 family)
MVDGLMVSVVAEGDSAFTFLYVDNVSVAFAESVDETDRERCSLEIQSFPRAHLPIPYFLTSKHTRSANQSMAVTVATQLTLDRLPNLQRLVRCKQVVQTDKWTQDTDRETHITISVNPNNV